MTDQEFEVVEAMFDYGGSFVQQLSICFHRADPFNFEKLKDAFPEYWEEYSEIAKNHGKKINESTKIEKKDSTSADDSL